MSNLTSQIPSTVKIFIIRNNIYETTYIIKNEGITKSSSSLVIFENNKLRRYNHESSGDNYTTGDVKSIFVDGIFIHFFLKELKISHTYRTCVLKQLRFENKQKDHVIAFRIQPPRKEIIDYQWADRTSRIAWERAELDHAMSWLSTLGGAFSALGEEFSHCAEMAGRISFHQLGLAIRLGDPMTVARCKLYMSLSLIQRGSLHLAKQMILEQYNMAKKSNVKDVRLINMCKGIWSKLQYCWKIKKSEQKLCKIR